MSIINFQKVRDRSTIILQKQLEFDNGWEKLPPGLYEMYNSGGMFSNVYTFEPQVQRDTLIKFKHGIIKDVIKKTSQFFDKRTTDIYSELKIFHSMGMIFFGPHGTGKTCTCFLIMEELVKDHSAICLNCTGRSLGFILGAIKRIRELQDNPIIIFVDEVEKSFHIEENNYLTYLDGTDSINKTIFIGCTNYINKIPARIKYRKSRIKYLFEIKCFPIEVYKEYIIDRIPSMTSDVIAQFAYRAEEKGLTLDQLKHSIIDYRLEGVSVEDSINGVLEERATEYKPYPITEDYTSKLIEDSFSGLNPDDIEDDTDEDTEEKENDEDS